MSDRIGGAMPKWQATRFTIHQLGEAPQPMAPGQVPGITPIPGLFVQVSAVDDPLEVVALPVNTPADATRGLGLDPAEDSALRKYLESLLGSDNEAVLRQQVLQYAMGRGFDADLRRVVLARALQLYNNAGRAQGRAEYLRQRLEGLRKPGDPMWQVIKAERFHLELDTLQKGGPFIGPNGGKWRDSQHTQHWTAEDEAAHWGSNPHPSGSAESSEFEENKNRAVLTARHHDHIRSMVKDPKGWVALKNKAGGLTQPVPIAHQHGSYAVHPDLGNTPMVYSADGLPGAAPRLWTVTHVPSGGAVTKRLSRADAKELAKHLDQHAPSGDKEALVASVTAWRAGRKEAKAKEAAEAEERSRKAYEEGRAADEAREKADAARTRISGDHLDDAAAHALSTPRSGWKDRDKKSYEAGVAFGKKIVQDKVFPDKRGADVRKQLKGMTDARGKAHVISGHQPWMAEDEASSWLTSMAKKKAGVANTRVGAGVPITDPFWRGVHTFGEAVRYKVPDERRAQRAQEDRAALAKEHGVDLSPAAERHAPPAAPAPAPEAPAAAPPDEPVDVQVQRAIDEAGERQMTGYAERFAAREPEFHVTEPIKPAPPKVASPATPDQAAATARAEDRSKWAHWEAYHPESHVAAAEAHDRAADAWHGQPEAAEHRAKAAEHREKARALGATLPAPVAPAFVPPPAKPRGQLDLFRALRFHVNLDVLRKDLGPAAVGHAGEGSRGGHVLGHTRSGKPIYARADRAEQHAQHTAGWTREDHADASDAHERAYRAAPADTHQREYHRNLMEAHDAASERTSNAGYAAMLKRTAAHHVDVAMWHARKMGAGEVAFRKSAGYPENQLLEKAWGAYKASRDVLRKGDPRGGKYHARVKTDAGNFRYYYDEERFRNSKHSPVMGATVLKDRLRKELMDTVGDKGLRKDQLTFGDRYPDGMIADLVKELADAGQLTWAGDVLKKPDPGVTVRPETLGIDLAKRPEAKRADR